MLFNLPIVEEFGELPDQFIADMVQTVHLIDLNDFNEIEVLCCVVAEE